MTADPSDNMVLGPCGYSSIPLRYRAGCKLNSTQVMAPRCIASDFAPTDYVCYTSGEVMNSTLQATPAFASVDEPQDPRYYSTCVLKGVNYGFPNVPAYPVSAPSWQANGACIPCSFLSSVESLSNTTVPNWEKVTFQTSNCQPCN